MVQNVRSYCSIPAWNGKETESNWVTPKFNANLIIRWQEEQREM